MFGIGIFEILVILIVAVIFLGPDKLPQAAVDIAKFMRALRKTINDAKETFDNEVRLSELKKEALSYKETLTKDITQSVNSLTSVPKDITNEITKSLNEADSNTSQNTESVKVQNGEIQKSPETLALESLNFQSEAIDKEIAELNEQALQENGENKENEANHTNDENLSAQNTQDSSNKA